MLILGIETSCDETGAAVVQDGVTVLSNILASQEDIHGTYGGVVPELACRRHVEVIDRVVERALKQAGTRPSDLSAIAVTKGPGLMGALLIGVSFARSMAYAWDLNLVPVDHLEGHLCAFLLESDLRREMVYPVVGMVVSGGHTNLYLMKSELEYQLIGRTVDDSAGEAFDKAAKMLGLGFPGGPLIDKLSKRGNPQAICFPRPHLKRGGFNFSFSGLKTSLKYYLQKQRGTLSENHLADIAASYQESIVDVLATKGMEAVDRFNALGLLVAGGVASNSALRNRLRTCLNQRGQQVTIPQSSLCTDNGAMIASAGFLRYPPDRKPRGA